MGGALFCSQSIFQKQTRFAHPTENGQQDGDMLHQSPGRNEITCSVAHSLPAVAMVPPKGHRERSHSRSGILYSTVLSGVGVEHNSVEQDHSSP